MRDIERSVRFQQPFRAFYANATARILIDTPAVTCLQYADTALNRCEIQLFTKLVYAKDVLIFPVVDENAKYLIDGQTRFGKDIKENGLYCNELTYNSAITISLIKV